MGRANARLRSKRQDQCVLFCQMCGAVAGEPHHEYPHEKTVLHVGTLVGNSDEFSSRGMLCSICHEGASKLTSMSNRLAELLAHVSLDPNF